MKLSSSFVLLVGADAFDIKQFLLLQNQAKMGAQLQSGDSYDMKRYLLTKQNRDIMAASNTGSPLTADKMSDYLSQINSVSGSPLSFTDIFMGGQGMTGINKDQWLEQQKEQMFNNMFAQMNDSPQSQMMFQFMAGGKGFVDRDQLIYSQMGEPMGTIMRLKKNGHPAGERLMKRMIAQQTFGNDPVLPDLFVNGDKEGLKQYMISKQFENMGNAPGGEFMQTLMYRKLTGEKDASITDKELLAAGSFAAQLDQNGASVKPNDAYLMFKFLKMQTDKNAGKVDPATILEVALGEDVASIKTEDFEQLFGIEQRDFVCVAHENSIRVPCLVNQATVTAEECPAHCCFNSFTSAGEAQAADAKIPICYHNLLGKIGAGIARHMINDANIEKMFGGDMPDLHDLTDAKDWGEAQMPEVLRRLNKGEGEFFGNPQGQANWWDNSYNSSEGKFNIYITPAPKTVGNSQYVPRGPTALPYTSFVPETGAYGVGREDATNPLIAMDQIVNAEIAKVKAQLNSNSYSCRLIPKEHMVDCYANNYDALIGATPETACAAKGCCFREQNLFEDKPVCYRSLRAGFCDPHADASFDPSTKAKANEWWKANPKRVGCGAQAGVTKNECLLNPQCCYSEKPRISGDPVCYHRGGVESLMATAGSAGHDAQCSAINVATREACFDNASKFGKIFNKVATKDQCETAGCCFDANSADAAKQMTGIFGGSMDFTGPHCFKKVQPDNDGAWADVANTVATYKPSSLIKTCDDSATSVAPKWPQILQNKWSKNAQGEWFYEETTDKRPAEREKCHATTDRHECVYTLGCCFEKSVDPREAWCYKPRYVEK